MEGVTVGDKPATMVCVHCGHSVQSVYVEYSPGNIRLSTCARCQSPVDEYVESETMILIIDAVLHKPEAYRHVFFNYPRVHHVNLLSLIWKALILLLFLDTCRCTLQGLGNEELIQWESLTSFLLTAGKVVVLITYLNCTFLVVLFVASHAWPRRGPDVNITLTDVLLAILLSSHFKLFVFAMMVWEFSPLMGFMVDMLVLSSNIIALKVMLNTTTVHAAVAIISAFAVKTAMGTLLGLPGLDLLK